jgi:hypothetical protein
MAVSASSRDVSRVGGLSASSLAGHLQFFSIQAAARFFDGKATMLNLRGLVLLATASAAMLFAEGEVLADGATNPPNCSECCNFHFRDEVTIPPTALDVVVLLDNSPSTVASWETPTNKVAFTTSFLRALATLQGPVLTVGAALFPDGPPAANRTCAALTGSVKHRASRSRVAEKAWHCDVQRAWMCLGAVRIAQRAVSGGGGRSRGRRRRSSRAPIAAGSVPTAQGPFWRAPRQSPSAGTRC